MQVKAEFNAIALPDHLFSNGKLLKGDKYFLSAPFPPQPALYVIVGGWGGGGGEAVVKSQHYEE